MEGPELHSVYKPWEKMGLQSSKMMFTSCSLFRSTWSDFWQLLSWGFLLSIINPRFFSAVVMTTSEPIILWNDRICFSCCYCFLRVHFFTFVYTEFCCCHFFFGQSSIYIHIQCFPAKNRSFILHLTTQFAFYPLLDTFSWASFQNSYISSNYFCFAETTAL